MLLKKNRKQLNNDKSKEKLPFHYPILLSNKNCEKNQYTRINKKAFYYIYNEYHKKYLKDKNNRRKMSKGNSIDNKNKSNNEINLSFHRKFRFIPKNKKDNKREFSNSISIHKYNTINSEISIPIQNFEDKINDISLNKNDKGNKKSKFRRCSSNYHIYNQKFNFQNKIFKKDNNSFQNKNENENKSFAFNRNSKNRMFSSKSFCSNDKNKILDMSFKYNMDKKMIYNKRMTKIDKFLKLLNNDNQKVHHLSFNKMKDINNIFNDSETNNLKIMKNNIINEYKNKRTTSNYLKIDKNKKIKSNNILYKYFIPNQTQLIKKEEQNNKEINKSNELEIKYEHNNNSIINLYDREKNKNIHKMIEYVYNYEKFQDKNNINFKKIKDEENKKVNDTFYKEKIKGNYETAKINAQINIKKIHLNKDNNYLIHNDEINNNFNQKNSNKIHLNKEEYKFLSNEENNYNKNNSSINNQRYENEKMNQNNYIKNDSNNNNLNEIKTTNNIKETRNNSFNSSVTTKINNNADIVNVRKFLNNYYKNKYNNKLLKQNSFNYTSDKSQSFNENNYIDSLKNNLIENLINEDKNNNNNNSYYYNNLSSNVNINININQNNSNKKVEINSNNNEIKIINQKRHLENKKQNSIHLLTPSFIYEESTEHNESKNKIENLNKKITLENNKTNEIHNCKNILNIPFNPENNKKFANISGNDYTFKNKNYNYRNRLMKNNHFQLNHSNHSSIEQNKNSFFEENYGNKQSCYNINSQKRKEDLFQLLNFSQNLKSKGK